VLRKNFTRKFRRELFNFARELDFSGWYFLLKYTFSKFRRENSDELKLENISGVLAHFPRLLNEKRILEAKRLSSEINRKSTVRDEVQLSYSLVVKPYLSNEEKGLIVVSFENQLENLLNLKRVDSLLDRYYIVFIPSWTGLFSSQLFRLISVLNGRPLFLLPVHESERKLVKYLGENCHALPFNAASWVNSDFFHRSDLKRDIDCLIVANFATFKRHWLLFKALKGLPNSVSAVCVGVPLGQRDGNSIRREAEEYGVLDRVIIVENPSQEDLRDYFQRAKVFCAMSYREGSYIAVAEALISGTPVIMFENAHVGSKSFISSNVGALVSSVRELRTKIKFYLNLDCHDKIRNLAFKDISAQENVKKLNRMLSRWSEENGMKWSQNIVGFYSMRLGFYYFEKSDEDLLSQDYKYLSEQGLKFALH